MCVCVFMCVCVIANQSTSKEPHVSDLSECVLLLYKAHIKVGPCGTKVPRLDMCRFILLSKIAHQIWHDQPFSQRHSTIKQCRGGWR